MLEFTRERIYVYFSVRAFIVVANVDLYIETYMTRVYLFHKCRQGFKGVKRPLKF